MDNFADLFCKQDLIHLESLTLLTDAVDRVSFMDDVTSIEDLELRVGKIKKVRSREEVIEADWSDFEKEYKELNNGTGAGSAQRVIAHETGA